MFKHNIEQATLSKIIIPRRIILFPFSCIIIFDTPSRFYNSNEIQNSFNDTGRQRRSLGLTSLIISLLIDSWTVNYLEAHHDVHDSWHARRLTFTDSIYLFFSLTTQSRVLLTIQRPPIFSSSSFFFSLYIITRVKTDQEYILAR